MKRTFQPGTAAALEDRSHISESVLQEELISDNGLVS